MAKRFAIGAQRGILCAVAEGETLGIEKGLSTKHLLRGLLDDSNSTAVRILLRMGLSMEQMRAEIERQSQIKDERPYSIEMTEEQRDAVFAALGPDAPPEKLSEALQNCYPGSFAFRKQFSMQAIDLAYSDARNLGTDDVIDTEHLLLGLIREKQGLAGRVLMSLGVEPERVRRLIRDPDGSS